MNVKMLKSKLVEKGMNVEDLAKMLGIDRSTMYRKLADRKRMTIKDALAIRDALHLSSKDARDIFFGEMVA